MPDSGSGETPEVPLAPGAAQGSVLVVDDQKNMRATTALLLRQAGYQVGERRRNGALEQCPAGHFDVVLTDLRMQAWTAGIAPARPALLSRRPRSSS